ncbi:unnamed protein product [Adineta steineri]|uniref:Uncharacterized protein n=1 Tax=Adineta steineri TaxID=433720 RepID=A0A814U9P5_9BILA|nr:unnamed protein product [Adineta steineri]
MNLDRPDKSITKKTHRNESSSQKPKEKEIHNSHELSSDNEILKSPTPTKKPRLESRIQKQSPPPSKISNDNVQQPSTVIKPNRTERIVVLEESRTDSIGSVSTRVSITTKKIYNEEHSNNDNNNSSEDETEVDLRERLLREKAIKSMKLRQIQNPNNDNNTKPRTTSDRIVYDLK